MTENVDRVPQLGGTYDGRDLRRLCGDDHGDRGYFAHDALAGLNDVVFDC